MRKLVASLVASLVIFLISSLQAEVSVESIRTSGYDYACSCTDAFFSAHQRQDKAIASCATRKLNVPSVTCEVKGGTWRINVQGANAQIGVSDPPPPLPPDNGPPVWTDTPSVNCTEGVDSNTKVIPDFLNDPENDVITLVDGGGCTLPTGVTIKDANDTIDCANTTVAGTTTGCTINATDAAGSNITVLSPAFPITIAAAGGGSGYEDIIDDMVGFAKHYGVDGGAGGTLVTVTNCNNSGAGSLRQALSDASGATWMRFTQDLACTMNLSSPLTLNKPDITIDGRGADITIVGPGGSSSSLNVRYGAINWILMYLKFEGPNASNNDLLQVDNTASFGPSDPNGIEQWWIYHVLLHDAEDGNIDIRRQRGKFTIQEVESTYASGTGYNSLVTNVSSQTNNEWDAVITEGTWYRNYWNGTGVSAFERAPRLSAPGNFHLYNNYHFNYSRTAVFCVSRSTTNRCEQLLENNIVLASPSAPSPNYNKISQSEHLDGWANLNGNLFLDNEPNVENNPGGVFTPPYTYTEMATATTGLRDGIVSSAGWQDVPFPGDP